MSLLQSTLALLHLRRGGKSSAPPPPARTVSLTLPSLNGGREQEARDRPGGREQEEARDRPGGREQEGGDRPGGREQTSTGCSLSLEDRQEPPGRQEAGGMGYSGTGEVQCSVV